jgi:WS/DGAT/MGAT family acyltransferase
MSLIHPRTRCSCWRRTGTIRCTWVGCSCSYRRRVSARNSFGTCSRPTGRAPKTILNGSIGGARRFAAQSWEIERIQRVAKSSAMTLNDVVLAMVSGALREYLLEQHALPDEPMTAMVPVSLSLRAESAGKDTAVGNATGAIIVNLATDREHGATRLEEIAYSSRQAKKILSDLTPTQILALSALQILPLALGPIPGFVKYTNPPFNVVVSNVPGPRKDPRDLCPLRRLFRRLYASRGTNRGGTGCFRARGGGRRR